APGAVRGARALDEGVRVAPGPSGARPGAAARALRLPARRARRRRRPARVGAPGVAAAPALAAATATRALAGVARARRARATRAARGAGRARPRGRAQRAAGRSQPVNRGTFGGVVRRVERRLVAGLGLIERPLPPELARLEGRFRDEPVTLLARAYSGPRLRYLRCVEVSSPSHLDIGNVLALPRAELALPLLGVDLVEVGRDTAVVVADLSPMAESEARRAHE